MMSKFSLDILQRRVFPFTQADDPDIPDGASRASVQGSGGVGDALRLRGSGHGRGWRARCQGRQDYSSYADPLRGG